MQLSPKRRRGELLATAVIGLLGLGVVSTSIAFAAGGGEAGAQKCPAGSFVDGLDASGLVSCSPAAALFLTRPTRNDFNITDPLKPGVIAPYVTVAAERLTPAKYFIFAKVEVVLAGLTSTATARQVITVTCRIDIRDPGLTPPVILGPPIDRASVQFNSLTQDYTETVRLQGVLQIDRKVSVELRCQGDNPDRSTQTSAHEASIAAIRVGAVHYPPAK